MWLIHVPSERRRGGDDVGVASAADEAYVASAVNASEILRLDVAHGAHLSFTLFRRVQELIDAGRGRYARVDYVFFTEADQVLRAALSPRALVAALGRQVSVVPNRFEAHVVTPLLGFSHSSFTLCTSPESCHLKKRERRAFIAAAMVRAQSGRVMLASLRIMASITLGNL